jgi:hypothetical protein
MGEENARGRPRELELAGEIFLAVTGTLVLLLLQGTRAPTFTADGASPEPRLPVIARALVRSRRHTGIVFGIALGVILVAQVANATRMARSPWDLGPLRLRSDVTLALQATGSATNARAELQRRGASAVPAIVAMLHDCPMTLHEAKALRQTWGQRCTEGGIPALLSLLADLGGPEALAEVQRWVRASGADPIFRDQAAPILARMAGRDAAGLHATDQIPRLVAALDRNGPQGQGARDGLRALGDLDTSEGWAAFLELGHDADPAWRREALAAYRWMTSLPKPFVDYCLEELDDTDREARDNACNDLAVLTHLGHVCVEPNPAGRLRDAVAGRPPAPQSEPQPPYAGRRPLPGRPLAGNGRGVPVP